MSDVDLIHKVAKYCWSNKFLDVFQKYFTDHAYAFEDAPPLTEGEHNMQYYELFQDYLHVYEDTLTDYLEKIDVPIEEFYQQVREVKEDSLDPYLQQFVKCLLASADYDSFYRVMSREGKAYKLKKNMEMRKSNKDEPLDVNSVRLNSPKAEAKSSSDKQDDTDNYKGSSKESYDASSKEIDSPRDYK